MRTYTERREGQPFAFLKNIPVSLRRVEPHDAPPMTGLMVGKVSTERLILWGQKALDLRTGEEVIVQMAVRNQVLEFRTRVMETSSGGTDLILLAMPEKLDSLDLRRGTRLNVFIPAHVYYSPSPVAEPEAPHVSLIPGRMVNLSHEGCCLSTKRPLAAELPIRVTFELPDARSTYRLAAQVKRHLGRAGDGVFVQGVQFDARTEHLSALADLQQWISQNLPYCLRN